MTILMKRDILSESETRFYIAESILAVDSVHQMNYIHRDLKPDNILLDHRGHIKLSDFGLCKHTDITAQNPYSNLKKIQEDLKQKINLERRPEYRRNRKLAYSTVGTPDYIAPEVFGKGGYNETVDWWSIGVIMFEMLVGYPPFFSDDPSITCQKILHWRKTLVIPREANLSPAAVDLLQRFICDPSDRIGARGVDEIKSHPFFAGVDWDYLFESEAPWVPDLSCETDTSNFDKFEETEPFYPSDHSSKKKRNRKDINFVGFTFKKETESQRASLLTALQELESVKRSVTKSPTNVMW